MQRRFTVVGDGSIELAEPGAQDLREGRPRFGARLDGLKRLLIANVAGRSSTIGDRYALGRTIGAGAHGTVYEARDQQLQRKVALKIVAARTPAEVQRVVVEARALAKLSHPNVVEVFDVGVTEDGRGSPYVVMELVAGRTLERWFSEGPRPWKAVVEVGVEAARGLAAAHRAGIVHRDFKPANVLLGDDGRVRVLDFGLAADGDLGITTVASSPEGVLPSGADLEAITLTPTGAHVGTPAYMAPERYSEPASPASDQYALGLVLYEGLVGRRPIDAQTTEELRRRQREAPLRVPRSIDAPGWLVAAIERALSREPDARFADLDALIEALQRRRRPRRRALAIAAVGIAVVAGGAWLSSSAEVDSTCALGRQPWAEIVAAVPSQSQFLGPLQAQATAWQGVERSLCAAGITGSQRRCLDARVEDARALVGVIDDVDPADHGAVASALSVLRPPERCAGAEAATPVALTAEQAAAVAAVQRRLSRLYVLNATAQVTQGLAEAPEVLAAARETGYAPAISAAAWLHARFAQHAGEIEQARRLFEEGYFAAHDGEQPWWAAQSASALLGLYGAELRDSEHAQRWAEHAEAAFERIGVDPLSQRGYVTGVMMKLQGEEDWPALEVVVEGALARLSDRDRDSGYHASLFAARGICQTRGGRNADAVESFREAAARHAKASGIGSLPHAAMLDNLGVALLGLERTEEALAVAEQAFEIQRAQLGDDSHLVALNRGNLATILATLGRHSEGLVHADESVRVLEATHGPEHPDVARAHRIRAMLLAGMGPDYRARAIADYERAIRLFTQLGADDIAGLQAELATVRDPPSG